MKIGINASFARKPGTGLGEVTLNYLRALSKNNNNEIEIILYLEEELFLDLPSNFTKKILTSFYRRDDLLRRLIWEKFLLPKNVKEDNCNNFISLYQCPTVFSDKINHIMVVHDIVWELFPEYLNNWRKFFYWGLTKEAIKRADKIIAVSKNTKDDLIKYLKIKANKIRVNYIDVDEIYKQEGDDKKYQAVLKKYNLTAGYIYSGGGLDKRKNIDTLIYAYKILLDKNKDIPTLVISGKLMPQLAPLIIDVEGIIRDLKIENKVKILGFVAQEDLPVIYKNASLFVYPSLYEGFGLPLLEAMNMGVAIATSNNSSIREAVGENAVFFDPQDKNDMAKKIKEILKNKEQKRKNIIFASLRAKNFSWKKFIINVKTVLKKTV
jgi:glycosyltransferase involved in cell wall biosynthesis